MMRRTRSCDENSDDDVMPFHAREALPFLGLCFDHSVLHAYRGGNKKRGPARAQSNIIILRFNFFPCDDGCDDGRPDDWRDFLDVWP